MGRGVPERLGHLLSIDCLWNSGQRNVDIFGCTVLHVQMLLISPLGGIGPGYALGPQTSRGVRGGDFNGHGWLQQESGMRR